MTRTEEIVEAFHRLGSKRAVATELGVARSTVQYHLDKAGVEKPVVAGRLNYIEPTDLEQPESGEIKRYILTSAQNNTRVHGKFWENLLAYAEFLDAEIMVSRFTYDKSSYSSAKSVKPGRTPSKDDKRDAWYDAAIENYLCDDPEQHGSCRWRLAPGLVFAAEMNILPTAARPLSGLESYTGRESGIFPHAKLALESVASGKNEPTKFNYTTGTVTQRNYVQKKAGLKAEFHHAYGALIVEVQDGNWWVRQLNADGNGKFYDCPSIEQNGAVVVENGLVYSGQELEAINWGDVHAAEIDPVQQDVNWGDGGIIDEMSPRYQFMHDLLSFRSRSHHEMKQFGRMFQKHVEGIDSVEKEIETTAQVVQLAEREFCEMVVVNSNHDRHGERWLDECDYRKDPLNAEFFLEAQLERVRAIRQGLPWDFHEWSLKRAGLPESVRFLSQDESFVICRRQGGGIECGMHGDQGPNGARGTTANLTKMGRRVNKGHDHTATIMDGVYSAGACAMDLTYNTGPSSWSVSHIFTYPNGKRQLVTVWNGKWRAG